MRISSMTNMFIRRVFLTLCLIFISVNCGKRFIMIIKILSN